MAIVIYHIVAAPLNESDSRRIDHPKLNMCALRVWNLKNESWPKSSFDHNNHCSANDRNFVSSAKPLFFCILLKRTIT